MRTRRSSGRNRATSSRSRQHPNTNGTNNAANNVADNATNNATIPPRKKLKSQAPDVIVSVGSGDNKQEFECYKLFLCYSCDYFDTMLSHSLREAETSRIELPDKDPEDWKLFYEFIDLTTSSSAEVTTSNVLRLAPWFQEYQMDALLCNCDNIISTDSFFTTFIGVNGYSEYMCNRSTFWIPKMDTNKNTGRNVKAVEKLFEYLTISEQCSLKKSSTKALTELVYFMNDGYDLLMESNELMEKTIEVFQSYKIEIRSKFNTEVKAFYKGIIDQGNIDWDNELFCSLMKSKLKIMIMKRQMSDKDKLIGEMINQKDTVKRQMSDKDKLIGEMINQKDTVINEKDKVIGDMKRDIRSLPDQMLYNLRISSYYGTSKNENYQQCKTSLTDIINNTSTFN